MRRYKAGLTESLGGLSKQVKRIMPPLENALAKSETLAASMRSRNDEFGEFVQALQKLPQCEERGSAER